MRADDALRDLYRVFCQPTALAEETRGWGLWKRLVFMLRMAPMMFAAQAALVGIVTLAAAPALGGVDLLPWLWRAAAGLGLGVLWGVVWNVRMGVAWGVVWAVATWAVSLTSQSPVVPPTPPVTVPTLPTLPEGLAAAARAGAPLGLSFGVGLGLSVGAARGAWWGLALAIVFGVVTGAEGRTGGLVAVLSQFLIGYSALFVLLASFLIGYFRVDWYPVDTVATLWQRAAARRDPKQARRLLQRSPIYWREPIWLPLMGLRSFLGIVAEGDYGAAVEECLFIISRRPTQGRVARAALMDIMTGHLARLQTVRDIAAASDELGRARADGVHVPRLLGEALDGLQELARDAEQHLTATLPHNRRRALERLRDNAGKLARELALAGGGVAGMWAGVASKWQAIAEGRLEEMGEADEAAGYIHNPFVFGQPIEETDTNLFVGRRAVVREIEVSLLGAAQKPALVLWGPRRMGKTSVLLQLPRLLGHEFAPAFIDVQAMQVRESVVAFFRSLSEAAATALRRRGLEAKPLTVEEMSGSPFSVFAAWMQTVERELGSKRYLLLCLDEFERLETSITEGKLPNELMDQIRHIIQHHPQVVLLFAGSHRPDEMELNWPDALISTKMIHVSYLSEEEARQLITRPVPEFPVAYEPGSIERILAVTRCQPYLVQAVCFELVNILNVAERRDARVADVAEAISLALDSTHLYFAEMWARLSEPQHALLQKLAEGAAPEASSSPTGAYDTESLAAGVGSSRDEAEAELRSLESRSIVERVGDEQWWRLQVPMVGAWVKRRRR